MITQLRKKVQASEYTILHYHLKYYWNTLEISRYLYYTKFWEQKVNEQISVRNDGMFMIRLLLKLNTASQDKIIVAYKIPKKYYEGLLGLC